MIKLTIRRAQPEDFPALLAIDQTCFPSGVAYDSFQLRHYMSRRNAATFVAEHEGQIAGFLLLNVERRKGRATLVTVDVRASCRHLGIGAALMETSECLLKQQGVRWYQLQVDPSNAIALGFYERRGFRIVKTIKHYYANGADAYLMEKVLGGPSPQS